MNQIPEKHSNNNCCSVDNINSFKIFSDSEMLSSLLPSYNFKISLTKILVISSQSD